MKDKRDFYNWIPNQFIDNTKQEIEDNDELKEFKNFLNKIITK